MRKVRNAHLLLIMVLIFSFILAACSSQISAPSGQNDASDKNSEKDNLSKDGKITLTMWDGATTPETSIIYETIIKNYKELHPDIEIKRVTMKTEDIRNTIKPALTSKEGPDLFTYDSGTRLFRGLSKIRFSLRFNFICRSVWVETEIPGVGE
ncbi:type 2 periplasmic-binding domain-containing protein [Metabacillus halosaccharovorans]|uniref:ABC transporter substrate-binding protein n=1 Tax=Metabacillus halosaccharovorans TaxID=930124 RepID=A0ABT3DDJ1_9BACI|nr:hypothetical protein [Metabacillus halosaccharovorans]MCV9885140.1 hypothetical protein [Metabacillus halosaccharovorans]